MTRLPARLRSADAVGDHRDGALGREQVAIGNAYADGVLVLRLASRAAVLPDAERQAGQQVAGVVGDGLWRVHIVQGEKS